MTNFDDILNQVATKEMVNWNLEEFKKSHPSLYKVINKVAAIYPFGNDYNDSERQTTLHNFQVSILNDGIPKNKSSRLEALRDFKDSGYQVFFGEDHYNIYNIMHFEHFDKEDYINAIDFLNSVTEKEWNEA
ncbi:MAG: hypothetical protein CL528_11390 [Aequorivita sp.]|nr:hypothetical protein [Aequorivita sp.]MBP42370.1 hypothetical protein [Aequorivita sp.]|tara:strand:- start:96 stop:491 length:396 start_codon:yes stop_codon:yes gene_type:complete